jgi:dihydrofolate reductase
VVTISLARRKDRFYVSDIRIVVVVAVAENGVIGYEGGLPWRQSSDLKLFRKLTMGKPLIMGRRTFQSIGKPLDGRDNIVITRDPSFTAAGVSICGSVPEALTLARVLATTRGADEIAVIGGAEIYDAFLPDADRIYLTRVHAEPVGDKYFAPLDPALWRETSREPLPKGDRDQFETTLIVYDRDKGAGQ